MKINLQNFLFYAFGILDVFIVIRAYDIFIKLAGNVEHLHWSMYISLLVYVSLVISSALFFMRHKLGVIIYYFQFPLRVGYMYLSFGFLLLFAPHVTIAHNTIVAIALILEFVRLAATIYIHKVRPNQNFVKRIPNG